MALTPGSRLGVYEITAPIGEGGMGQVWRARDTKLDRDVAIKVLPEAFAHDADRLARFTREAKTLASLNHPHIAAIYGFEKSSGMHALVMELVEGEDLSQRIAKGAIPIDEALPIAKQIAEALEAAHEQGIIHRDRKPANIKVRADGTVKVLDFGLAKAMDSPAGSSPNVSQSPTITTPAMTQAGMILGTAAYMAPEQARGKMVDRRADIWAFGAVLFEMLTGTRAFRGEDVTDTLAAVVRAEPDWSAVPATTPAGLRRLLTRCLKKDPKTRLQAIGDARVQIDELLNGAADDASNSTPATLTTTASSRGRRPLLAALAVAAALIAAMATPTLRYLRQPPPSTPPERRLEITTPATDAPLQFALSPDGRSLVFVATGDGPSRLWLRPLDQAEARPLAGTEGATYPFWSPDSRSVGFFAANTLLRLDVSGGTPDRVAALTGTATGGSWSSDGTILFSRQLTGPLWRVAATGGDPVPVTAIDPPRQVSHRHPQFLPDGRHFLFHAAGVPETAGLYLGSLDGTAPTRLAAADSGGVFLLPDRVAFAQGGTLRARRLDLGGRVLTGDPTTLAEPVGVDFNGRGGFAVSDSGVVAYRGADSAQQYTWFDRTGKAVGSADEPGRLNGVNLSPDDQRVAGAPLVQGNRDIWLWDSRSATRTRLTFDAATDAQPIWSPDGRRIAFTSNRTGAYNLHVRPSDGSGTDARFGPPVNDKAPTDWSRDGRWVLYYEVHPTTGRDVWALDMEATDRPPRAVANTPADELQASFSPDGRWLAYQTNASGA